MLILLTGKSRISWVIIYLVKRTECGVNLPPPLGGG